MDSEARSRDLGDFQTPPDLVNHILRVLGPVGRVWPRVLEPTCGAGNFIAGLVRLEFPPREIIGLELQEAHARTAERVARSSSRALTEIRRANIFDVHLGRDLAWTASGPLLVLGNPPWITNAELGTLCSGNVPQKSNFRRLRGIDAMTGISNFDLAEHILIKVATELMDEFPSIAMLCKSAVARNVLRFASDNSLPVVEAYMRRIDARKWFGAAVEACLFCMKMGRGPKATEAKVYSDLFSAEPERTIGIGKNCVSSEAVFSGTKVADRHQPLAWRQGIKHDAASVMELVTVRGTLRNRLEEEVDVEPENIFPLLKGSEIFRQEVPLPKRSLIVTQRYLGDDTARLRDAAPKLWEYLNSHSAFFRARKSRVFNRRMDFSIFGVGEYSFSPYKVAVAGFYRTARFRALGPVDDRPVLLDDTCYFVACGSPEEAALFACLLNHPVCSAWVDSVIFRDSKRPITKALLSRIGIRELLKQTDRSELSSLFAKELERLRGAVCELTPSDNSELLAAQIHRILSGRYGTNR